MAHHKNRKPKPFKGHCTMCSWRKTDGTRNGRTLTKQELVAKISEREQRRESESDAPQ